VDRRQWLQGVIRGASDVAAQVVEEKIERQVPKQRRPPGAGSELEFLALCTRCGDCSKACPHQAVFFFTEEAGEAYAGTPVLDPSLSPCHLCTDYPCVAACEPKALELPEETPVLGAVRIDETRCITFKGPECGACAGLCPDGVKALTMSRCRPSVDESTCVGCGKCIEACPVMPPAVVLLPLE
jgi:ferredoxin-type protein NapG